MPTPKMKSLSAFFLYPFTKLHAIGFFFFSLWSRVKRLLLDLALKVLALDEVGDLVVVLALLRLLHVLVALGELAQGGQRVGAELVQDAGDQLGELLILAVAVDGESVGLDGGVHCQELVSRHVFLW